MASSGNSHFCKEKCILNLSISLGFMHNESYFNLSTAAKHYENEDPLTEKQDSLLESHFGTTEHHSWTDIDPFVTGDSASMVAFSLSTPTKDDPINFQNVLLSNN